MKRLHEICVAYGLDPEAERKLAELLGILARDPEAPTSITAPQRAVDTHVADSLCVLPTLAARPVPDSIVDIGSGAGFPGLPLAIAIDTAAVDLVESSLRKCDFLTRTIATLAQRNARPVCVRAEEWAAGEEAGKYELAVVRALAPLATLVEYASPLLREHGLLIAWKGARDPAEESHGAAAADALGMAPAVVESVKPFATARNRHLHVFEKVAPTPEGVPRRPGAARKRPFGGESSVPN